MLINGTILTVNRDPFQAVCREDGREGGGVCCLGMVKSVSLSSNESACILPV
jgi:hypothetical protein